MLLDTFVHILVTHLIAFNLLEVNLLDLVLYICIFPFAEFIDYVFWTVFY